MADAAQGDATESSDRLETAIRELRAQVTEDVLNLRARLLAVEQELETVRRGTDLGGGQPAQPEAPPRPRQRAEGRAKRGRRAKSQRAKRAGAAQRKARRRPASEDEPLSDEE